MAAASVAAASRGTVAAIACASDSGTKGRLSAGNRGRSAPGGSLERRKADELSGRGRAGEAGGSSACCHSGIGATLAVADARRAQQLATTAAPPPVAAAIARVREGTNTAAELANPRQWRMPAVSVSVRRAPGNVAASSRPFLSDSSARNISSSAILRRGASPAPLNDGLNHTLWAITRLAGSSFPSSSSPLSSSPSPSKFLVHSVAEKPPAAILEDDDSAITNRIWLSDVIAKKERAYFQRPWTGKDLTYLSHILLLHVASLAAPFTFTWDALAVFFSLYVLTGLFGITLSFHRNLSHKAFKLPKWLEYTFAYCGVQAMQGDPLEWVSSHRYHHLYCDTPLDPHSPKEGFWHSHICWLLDASRIEGRLGKRTNIADMENDPFYQFIRKTYPFHLVGLSVILFAWGGLPYLIWGVALRTVFVYHITWLVNSASHVWGSQKWNTGDLSRNNWWVALLAFGEGWHNNHHAFEYSARHGLDWWQLDLTWYVIKALEKMGLATNVKLPRPDQMERLSFPPSQ